MSTHNNYHPELVSADVVAKKVGVSSRTVLNWLAKGKIDAQIRLGRVIRFNLDETLKRLAERP